MKQSIFEKLDQILAQSTVVVDRPRGSRHPRYQEYIYPMDYGYLEGTKSQDGDGIDVWIGTGNQKDITGMLVIADALKKDSEVKVLLGCSHKEMKIALEHSNRGDMATILIERETR